MTRATQADRFDVLVVGAGIAGCEAALAAAGAGARVALASAGETFSGSSFFPGTWGLGLVGPAGEKDEGDFATTILEVGRGVALPGLVHALVAGIAPAVARIEARGVRLRGAQRPDERDFIPCFDRRCRSWHGLERDSYRAATAAALERAGVATLPRHELLDLVEDDGRVCGALLGQSPRRFLSQAWDRNLRGDCPSRAPHTRPSSSTRSSSSWRGSVATPARSSAAAVAARYESRSSPCQLRHRRSKQGMKSRSSGRCAPRSLTPRASIRATAGAMPATSACTSPGSATPRPTSRIVVAKSPSSFSPAGPTRPSPHVPGKKLEPENVSPALASATRAPAPAAASAASQPAMPAPTTRTSKRSA